MTLLASKDNPKVRHWRKLAQDPRYRRAQKRALIEGPHLLAAALEKGWKPLAVLATEEGADDPEIGRLLAASGVRASLVTPPVLRAIADTQTPQGVAAELAILSPKAVEGRGSVFLEGVQDPSNVGAIIRSAAAFGLQRIVLDSACADAWSPKALRAGMGGHFALHVQDVRELGSELDRFQGLLACAVPRGGRPLGEARLNGTMGWIFGAEGKGVSEPLLARAGLRVTIPMAPGVESLNVAAAAAICFYEASRKSGSDPDFAQ